MIWLFLWQKLILGFLRVTKQWQQGLDPVLSRTGTGEPQVLQLGSAQAVPPVAGACGSVSSQGAQEGLFHSWQMLQLQVVLSRYHGHRDTFSCVVTRGNKLPPSPSLGAEPGLGEWGWLSGKGMAQRKEQWRDLSCWC